MTRTSEQGGVEYAIRRDKDGAWLYDGDMDGTDVAWEPDADNATWTETPEQAVEVADVNRLTTADYTLQDGYSVWERDWVNEEDLTEDWEPAEPRPYKG
ncbi:hypothetical protein [Bifidobacterium felsineum]|uniref:hypothetical protein n=1 Tax=Bifidobacterium felsineum TaxID=2045440 RepID=UPI001BDD6D70|nr:hypothetical protein [Bifidobacterium felsineum]MBT1164565.1 hypothetical protein [Bifidobacterium felsineum]